MVCILKEEPNKGFQDLKTEHYDGEMILIGSC